jgi:hypothetical protein
MSLYHVSMDPGHLFKTEEHTHTHSLMYIQFETKCLLLLKHAVFESKDKVVPVLFLTAHQAIKTY